MNPWPRGQMLEIMWTSKVTCRIIQISLQMWGLFNPKRGSHNFCLIFKSIYDLLHNGSLVYGPTIILCPELIEGRVNHLFYYNFRNFPQCLTRSTLVGTPQTDAGWGTERVPIFACTYACCGCTLSVAIYSWSFSFCGASLITVTNYIV